MGITSTFRRTRLVNKRLYFDQNVFKITVFEKQLSEKLWERGAKNPIPRVKVITKKEDDEVRVQLFGLKFSEKVDKDKKKAKKEKKKEEKKEEKDISKQKQKGEEKVKPTLKSRKKNM